MVNIQVFGIFLLLLALGCSPKGPIEGKNIKTGGGETTTMEKKPTGENVARSYATRIADQEVVRIGYNLDNLRHEVSEEKDIFKINYFPKIAQKGGGVTVEVEIKTGKIRKVTRWK